MPTATVKQSPSIRQYLVDPAQVTAPAATTPPQQTTLTTQKQEVTTIIPPEQTSQPPQAAAPQTPETTTPLNPDDDRPAFQIFWDKLVDTLFSDCPTLHAPLKNYPPSRNGNIFTIPVKNDFQLHDISLRKPQVLQYLHDNLDKSIEDIDIQMAANLETKRIILVDSDKLNVLREQNPDLTDFFNRLELQVKN